MDEIWQAASTRCRSCTSAPGAGSCSRRRAATSRSRSRTTPSSTDSGARRSPGSGRSSSSRRPVGSMPTWCTARLAGSIVDYLGSHQHLAVDIDLSVDDEGGLSLRSGAQRFYEGLIGFDFPMLFSGMADVREWYDEATHRFRIAVDVRNRTWGRLFGYTRQLRRRMAPGRGRRGSRPRPAPPPGAPGVIDGPACRASRVRQGGGEIAPATG